MKERTKLIKKIDEYKNIIETTQKRLEESELMLSRLDSEIGEGITDHAKVRFVERVLNIDIVGQISEFVKDVKEQSKILGDGKYPVGDYIVVVRDRTITTIYKGK